MRSSATTFLAMTGLLFIGGCAGHVSPPDPFARLELRDVQALWGGQDVWLYADGRLVVQVLDPRKQGKAATRYTTTATARELKEFQSLLDAHHFSDLTIADHPGNADEVRPTITVETQSGKSHTVSKWDHDKNADFDPIYRQLLLMAKQAERNPPTYEGPPDWNWKPEETNAATTPR